MILKKEYGRVVCILLMILVAKVSHAQTYPWKAKWIAPVYNTQESNSWFVFTHETELPAITESKVLANIAVDTKYWLWINGEMVVFEGGLKRGPNPNDTYYDEVDIKPYLKTGKNKLTILVWYFGKNGFAHNSSGMPGLIFDCQTKNFNILSDTDWKGGAHRSFGQTVAPYPNFRLAESNIRFDARAGKFTDLSEGKDYEEIGEIKSFGTPPVFPWNNLVKRPIPFWKDYGVKYYIDQPKLPFIATGDTIVCKLPYNAQMTPYLKVEAQAGQQISIFTDNYTKYNGDANGIRAEYVTCEGVQEYENLGWLNGHEVYYVIPKGVKVLELKYRETGYHTELSGSFHSSDTFLNKLWQKAQRTLYLTMRDNFMDCPDRERAQWTGDAVMQSGQAFYALDNSSYSLSKKWLQEFFNWQRKDNVLYGPVPSGNWNKELPDQSMATIGYYGLWNYYFNTGDKETLAQSYDKAREYLALWEVESDGLVKLRKGDWTWGDWGDNKDMLLIFNLWYYLALKGMHLSAIELDKKADVMQYESLMSTFKTTFNQKFWNGKAYRDPLYQGTTDDRAQALAVVAGVVQENKYPALLKIFKEEFSASPYMEKYVFEAMFMMGYAKEALDRHRLRFKDMVNDDRFSTLFEGWEIGSAKYGGGTVNHSWSGGGLTVLSQYLVGISPLSVAYEKIAIKPQLGDLTTASATMNTVKGKIKVDISKKQDGFTLQTEIPKSTSAVVFIPKQYKTIKVNGKKAKLGISEVDPAYSTVTIKGGLHKIQAF